MLLGSYSRFVFSEVNPLLSSLSISYLFDAIVTLVSTLFIFLVFFILLTKQKAVQASPKNRFAWHVWGVFEANLENIDQGRKLLTIGHMVNPRDPVLLQSLALIEYKHSSANLARVLFRRASEMDPRHQPVWIVRLFF